MSPPSNRSRNPRQSKSPGQVRIIAGQWRGRKLNVPDVPGLRPTGDRLRETLFNWLQPSVAGSHCLDLFAGTGALGFEAKSRYAASVTLIEPDRAAFRHLQGSAQLLGQEGLQLVQSTAERFLEQNTQLYDIVFVDPPFEHELQWSILSTLTAGHLAPNARVYVETPARQLVPAGWPSGCLLHREKQLGDVCARLFEVTEVVP